MIRNLIGTNDVRGNLQRFVPHLMTKHMD